MGSRLFCWRERNDEVDFGCELISNLYLWLRFYNPELYNKELQIVVNCFRICIFDSDFTTFTIFRNRATLLWIAFEFVSLTQILQLMEQAVAVAKGCELLSNLYLWLRFYNVGRGKPIHAYVVNCFRICIFDSDFTTAAIGRIRTLVLWIAFEFVSLTQILQHLG